MIYIVLTRFHSIRCSSSLGRLPQPSSTESSKLDNIHFEDAQPEPLHNLWASLPCLPLAERCSSSQRSSCCWALRHRSLHPHAHMIRLPVVSGAVTIISSSVRRARGLPRGEGTYLCRKVTITRESHISPQKTAPRAFCMGCESNGADCNPTGEKRMYQCACARL